MKDFQSSFDVAFATPRISSHNALKDAVPALWHLLRLFVSPLQRAGTCEAHPPPPEGMPCVPDINAFILSVPASKLNASELGFRFLPPKPSPILLFLPPDPHGPPKIRGESVFGLQNAIF